MDLAVSMGVMACQGAILHYDQRKMARLENMHCYAWLDATYYIVQRCLT